MLTCCVPNTNSKQLIKSFKLQQDIMSYDSKIEIGIDIILYELFRFVNTYLTTSSVSFFHIYRQYIQ